MSYYIGATGEYIWEELLENTTSNVVIANHINLDAGALTEAAQQIITDSLGTAVGELIAPITEVPSATGVGVVALTALGLLSYYKLNRTAVQDVDSMVYSADYASILTPGMFDDRVRIRYDSNQFSNAFYYVGGVKKGEILTSRLNLLPVDSNNVDIYTSTGKVGIGTATPATQLHIYHATDSILRLGTATNGKASIEFVRGAIDDVYNDFRLINQSGVFRLQYENNLLAYGDTGTNLIYASSDQISLGKKTEILGNVGIGTGISTTYALDVNGTVNATAFRGDGANITNVNATSITTGTINLDRISLTTTKLYQNFNTTNFAIIDDKIDLPPNYSFTITGYDSQTLFPPSTDRKYKGRMSCSYDDRNGVYKLLTTENKTDNVAVLQYKVGDKISIRNLANPKVDYLDYNGSKYFNSLVLYKRPSNQPLNWNNIDAYSVGMYEWRSSDGVSIPEATVYTLPLGNRTYPFTTVITFIIETGFNYYLAKLYNRTNASGGTVFVEAIGYGDDFNDFNRAFGAGQTFRLQTGANFLPSDYQPKFYVPPKLEIGSIAQVGGVKPRRGLEINAETGDLDAVPLSSDLITNMNTSQFVNNTGTNKIDISSSYVAPNATKLATARNIAGVSFDGTGDIAIPYANLTNKPTIPAAQVSSDWAAVSGVSMILNKPSLFSGSYTDLTNKPTIPAAQVSSDWAAVSGVSMILNKPSLFSGSYTDLTNKPTIPAAQVSSDWNAVSGVSMILNKPTIPAAQVNSDWNAVSGLAQILNKPTLITMTDINNTSNYVLSTSNILVKRILSEDIFGSNYVLSTSNILVPRIIQEVGFGSNYVARINSELTTTIGGKANTSHTHIIGDVSGLQTALDGKQAIINNTAGQLIIGNGNGATTTNTGLTWTTATNLLSTSNLAITGAITGNITANGNISVGTGSVILPVNSSSAYSWGIMANTLLGRTITAGVYSTSALAFDTVLKAESNLHIQSGSGSASITISTANNVGIGKTNPNIAYKLDVVGDVNITGAYRINGTSFTGSQWINNPTIPANIYFSSGNVGIGIADVTTSLGVGGSAEIVAYGATVSLPPILTCTPAFTQFTPPTAPDNTIYRGAIFNYVFGGYSLTIPAGGIITDILMVGGGGGGSSFGGGGGGGGAVLYGQNIFIPAGIYTLYVANSIPGQANSKGESTSGFGATILGGGSCFSTFSFNGGSGGGGSAVNTSDAPFATQFGRVEASTKGVLLDNAIIYNGSNGGSGVLRTSPTSTWQGGGGGGVGGVGGNGNTAGTATGNGGVGVLVNITGTDYYWGGGGGAAGCLCTAPNGGIGGGGAGTRRDTIFGGTTIYGTGGGSAYNAPVNNNGGAGTGGGGGSVNGGGAFSPAGYGGSGIIILKYRSPPPCSSLVNIKRNATSTGNYNMGLVGGDFKIQSTIGTTVVDRLVVNTLTNALTLQDRAMTINNSGNATFSTAVNAPNITATNTLTSTTTSQLNNVLINGIVSNNNIGTLMEYRSTSSFGAAWTILMNPWITNNLNSAQLNIHNLVVWDTATGSSYFAVLGFTASLPQQVLYLSTAGQNKGVSISSLFGYDGTTGNGYIYFPGVAITNQLTYRLT